jgi:DNA-binding MarR family transcriptional regulator
MTTSTADTPAVLATAPRDERPGGAAVAAAPPTVAIAALEQELSRLFATAKTLVRDRAVAVHPELSPGSYTVLAALVRSGPQHASVLAATLYMDKSVISRIVRQLADLGLAERRADPSDGRAFYIAATPAAVRKVDAIRDDYRRSLYRFLADWDPADIAQLTGLLARLIGASEAH